jgi:hypothetical protein
MAPVRQAKNERWIVTDSGGYVHGRILSPWYSSALYLARTFFPELEELNNLQVWPWGEATGWQRHEAKAHPWLSLGTAQREHLMATRPDVAEVVERLRGRFVRTMAGGGR